MNARAQQNGFMLSATLHGAVVALLLLWMFAESLSEKPAPRILELVAGEGTNYMATEAPAVGVSGGVKLNLPAPPTPKPEAAKPEPVRPEPTPPVATPPSPITPAPTKATPTKSPPTKAPRTPAQEIRRQLANADLRARRAVAKEREEEQKKAAAAAKIKPIDAEGIAKGVLGGSTANKDGGAGGKALTAAEGARMARFESLLISKLRQALEEGKPDGLSESLVTTVEFRWGADGSLSSVNVTKSSGSKAFDDAVRAAFRRVGTIGPRPDGKTEVLELDFKAKEQDGE